MSLCTFDKQSIARIIWALKAIKQVSTVESELNSNQIKVGSSSKQQSNNRWIEDFTQIHRPTWNTVQVFSSDKTRMLGPRHGEKVWWHM